MTATKATPKKKPAKPGSGTCLICGRTAASRTAIGTHLKTCLESWSAGNQNHQGLRGKNANQVHVSVSVSGSKLYWMELLVHADVTLQEIDTLLRETWLECCDHLSAFILGDLWVPDPDDPAPSDPMDDDEDEDEEGLIGLNTQYSTAVPPGRSVKYHYDFGDTSEIILTTKSLHEVGQNLPRISLLARNSPIDDDEYNSPRDGYPRFEPEDLKDPQPVPALH